VPYTREQVVSTLEQIGCTVAEPVDGSTDVLVTPPTWRPDLTEPATFVEEVVRIEGPVHLDEVTARIRSAWGLQRSGGRIQAAVQRAAQTAESDGRIRREGDFLSIPGATVRARSRAEVSSVTLRKPEMLPPGEIEVAIRATVAENLGAATGELIQSVARQFGFKATSTQLRDLIQGVLDGLVAKGDLTTRGELLVFAASEVEAV